MTAKDAKTIVDALAAALVSPTAGDVADKLVHSLDGLASWTRDIAQTLRRIAEAVEQGQPPDPAAPVQALKIADAS